MIVSPDDEFDCHVAGDGRPRVCDPKPVAKILAERLPAASTLRGMPQVDQFYDEGPSDESRPKGPPNDAPDAR